jgi:diketogulonate reductase-like aldo/keto reductase
MHDMPMMGLGTFQLGDNKIPCTATQVILSGLRLGYTHLDLAANYGNLHHVAAALKTAFKPVAEGGLGLKREDLWLTMKGNGTSANYINSLLNAVGVAYFDLYLTHHSTSGLFDSEERLMTEWADLSTLSPSKLHRIGVSNCYEPHLARLLAICERENLIRPFANEVEMNLLSKNKDLMDYCQHEGIQVIAYSPLGYLNSGHILSNNQELTHLAQGIGSTTAQAALALLLSKNVAVIPKSNHEARLLENFKAQDFVQSVSQHPELVTPLDSQEDMLPEGVTDTAIESKQHGLYLSWEVSPAPSYK